MEIRFQVGKSKACQFYINSLGWFASTFDSIDWEARDKALDSKPDMFKIWLCKQGSGFCATGKNMQRWFGNEITHCPKCGSANEDAAHLLHCPDTGRFSLFRQEVKSLQGWLEQDHTHPELARLLPQYILGRGAVKFASLPIMSVDILRLAHHQDLIGWDNFMEGKILHFFAPVQHVHLLSASSLMTPVSLRRPPVDFGSNDIRPEPISQPAAPSVRPKRSGSYTDPSNKRRKPD
jgi:hypothetical protein